MQIGYERGWFGAFTRDHAPGAIPNGTVVYKVPSDERDATPPGTAGIVLGSTYVPDRGYGYFVEWENRPRWAVLVVAAKLRV